MSENELVKLRNYLNSIKDNEEDFEYYYQPDEEGNLRLLVLISKGRDKAYQRACSLKYKIFRKELGYYDVHFAVRENFRRMRFSPHRTGFITSKFFRRR